jgi:hypothetical protein
VPRLAVPALVLTALSCAVLPAYGAPRSSSASQTIQLISTASREQVTDRAPKTIGRGVITKGDTVRGTSVLRNAVAQFGKPSGAVVGSDAYSIVFASAAEAVATATVKLPGGTVRVKGRFRPSDASAISLAVVGGTGKFAGARGTCVATNLSAERSLNVYRLRLPEKL